MSYFNVGKEVFDECGVFGIYTDSESVYSVSVLALHSLQHRGQESSGIAVFDGNNFNIHKGMGLVGDVFKDSKIASRLKGSRSIGHVRYSTSGTSSVNNAQPLFAKCSKGSITIAHNGNIVNGMELRKNLELKGASFQTNSDSEVILHLIALSNKDNLKDAILEALESVQGAYSLLIMSKDALIAIRDPFGFRPLCLGNYNGSYCVASETCAFNQIDAEYIREIRAGEMIIFNDRGMTSYFFSNFTSRISKNYNMQMCVFELIYLSRPDSNIFGKNVYLFRKMLGQLLAREYNVDADLVIPVPDSGIPAAIGYSEESGIPYDMGLLRSHYVGRTFIEPDSNFRRAKVKMKLNVVTDIVEGKRVVVIDDSIVRGTTSKEIVRMLRSNFAREIHFLSSSPPMNYPCFYGVNTPDKSELIASVFKNDINAIRDYLEADTVNYLSLDSLFDLLEGGQHESFCKSCFNGNYVYN